MNIADIDLMSVLQLFGYLIVIVYFVRSTKNIQRDKIIAEQKQADTVDKLVSAVTTLMKLHELEVTQRKSSDAFALETRMKLRLMLQQHKANHNQDIEGE